MAIGTGISAAIIIEGKLVEGPYLGEIGHLDVKSGIPCACESFGCLETVSTGPSIIRAYNELSPKKLANAKEVFEASLAGDSIAAAVWADAVEAIAFALTACVNLLSPEIIIIGGGVSKAGDALLAPIKKHFEKCLTFQPHPRLAIAELGDLAGMIGAGIAAEKALTR
jgi:glucokinase